MLHTETPKISIVIPVYKVEKYIRQCLDSIITQTFKDFEAILVDDGSPDESGLICDEYVKRDNRFKVIHKQNGGVGSARNAGIQSVRGGYLTFVDSDDHLEKTFLEGLYQPIAQGEDVDFVQGGCTNWKNGNKAGINQSYEYLVSDDPAILFKCFRGLTFSKLFRLENIRTGLNGLSLCFDEKMKIAEDLAFTLDYIITVKRYAFVPEVGYYYRTDNMNSATHTNGGDYTRGLHEYMHQYQSTMNYIATKCLTKEESKYRLGLMGRELFAKQRALYENEYTYNQCYRHILEDFTDEQRKLLGYWNFSGWQRPLALLQFKGYLRLYNSIMYILFKTQKVLKNIRHI